MSDSLLFRRLRAAAVVVVLAATAAACGGGAARTAGPAQPAADGATTTPQSGAARTAGESHDADPATGATNSGSTQTGGASSADRAGEPTSTDQQGGTADRPASSGKEDPYANVVPVKASLSPDCVTPGGSVQLNVVTDDGAFLGYQAIYSDGQGGGAPPFGAGYGGNDKGRANDGGHFTTSWAVAPTAPVGRGHVDVVVASNGQFGKTRVPFRVAGAGGCT